MKKSRKLALMLPLVSVLLGGCADIKKDQKDIPLDTVIEFSITSFYINAGKKLNPRFTATYGHDAKGNIFAEYIGDINLYGVTGPNNVKKIYKKNTSGYELYEYSLEDLEYKSKGNVNISSSHDTIPGALITSNTSASLSDGRVLVNNGWDYKEIDAISYKADGLQDLLDNADCTYYKLTKKDTSQWYEIAVQKDYRLNIFVGHMTAEGDYVPEIIPTSWNINHTNDYTKYL